MRLLLCLAFFLVAIWDVACAPGGIQNRPLHTHVQLIPAAQLAYPIPVRTTSAASLCETTGKYCRQALLQLINAERKLYGYAPLTLSLAMSDGTLSCVGATGHSRHMASLGYISHDQFSADVCYPYRYAGENVGAGSSTNKWSSILLAYTLMEAEPWSPGCNSNHHCNFLLSTYTHIGIGFALGGSSWFQTETFGG